MTLKPFLDHLEEFRSCLIKIGVTFILSTTLMFIFTPHLINVISWPLMSIGSASDAITLRTLRPASGFLIGIKISFLFGLLFALPLMLYFFSQFFAPALKPKERKWVGPLFLIGGGLFLSGVLFCYFVALPLTLKFLWGYSERLNLANEWTIEYYISFVVSLIFVFGLVFELPVIILGLIQASILTPEFLRQKRIYAILIIVIGAAFITPPDVISQILIAVPVILLYEACIWISKFFKRGQRQK